MSDNQIEKPCTNNCRGIWALSVPHLQTPCKNMQIQAFQLPSIRSNLFIITEMYFKHGVKHISCRTISATYACFIVIHFLFGYRASVLNTCYSEPLTLIASAAEKLCSSQWGKVTHQKMLLNTDYCSAEHRNKNSDFEFSANGINGQVRVWHVWKQVCVRDHRCQTIKKRVLHDERIVTSLTVTCHASCPFTVPIKEENTAGSVGNG